MQKKVKICKELEDYKEKLLEKKEEWLKMEEEYKDDSRILKKLIEKEFRASLKWDQ